MHVIVTGVIDSVPTCTVSDTPGRMRGPSHHVATTDVSIGSRGEKMRTIVSHPHKAESKANASTYVANLYTFSIHC